MDQPGHLNSDALRPLVSVTRAARQDLALRAGVSASAFSNYLAGARTKVAASVIADLAAALTELLEVPVHPRALTCYCPTPDLHQEEPTDG